MPIRRGTGADFPHIFHGTRPIQSVYRGTNLVWSNTDPPVILTFSALPSNIDLDTRSTGNVTLSWTALGTPVPSVARDTTKDINLGTGQWNAAASDGTTLWFVNSNTNIAVAYNASTLQPDSTKNVNLGRPDGTWSSAYLDSQTIQFIYLYNAGSGSIHSYEYSFVPGRPFVQPTGSAPRGSRLYAVGLSPVYGAISYTRLVGHITYATSWYVSRNSMALAVSTEGRPGGGFLRDSTRDIDIGFSARSAVTDGTTIWFGGRAFNPVTRQRISSLDISNVSESTAALNVGRTLWFVVGSTAQAYNSIPLGSIQTSRVFLEPQGTQIGQTYVTAGGVGVSETFDTPQPSQTQTYRLVITRDGGTSHSDAVVTITQNPVITNFRRVSFQQAPGLQAGTFGFRATIVGYPQPTLSYRFGNGRQGAITARHLSPSAGTNEFNFNWSIYHTVLNDSLVLTASNSSGSVSSTISRISN